MPNIIEQAKQFILSEKKRGEFKKTSKKRSLYQRKYNSTPDQKRRRAERNKARRELERSGRVAKGDGKDVDHRNKNTSYGASNLRVRDQSANRADNTPGPSSQEAIITRAAKMMERYGGAKKERGIWYHGTNPKNIKSILKQGLLLNPKEK